MWRKLMIVDKIENIVKYQEIPDFAKDFILKLSKDIELGRYSFADNNFANVESYETKFIDDAKFEAHKNYIDIQLLLSGKERIYVRSLEGLDVDIEYNPDKDIMFYKNSVKLSDFVTLDTTNFVMLYPHEAHAPQVAVDEITENVKKVVVKVKLG